MILMGTEFIDKTRPSREKYLDRRRAELGRRDLFTCSAKEQARSFTAQREGQADLVPGDALTAEAEGPRCVLRRAGRVVARTTVSNAALLRSLTQAGGIHPARVCAVGSIAPTVEFNLTD
jgi:hypothetical protein